MVEGLIPCIQGKNPVNKSHFFTVYVDGYLPILDQEVKIFKDEQNRIDFQFYEKPTKNGAVLFPDAACSAQQKRTIFTQEGLRRLRNTKILLGEEVQNLQSNKYLLKLKNLDHSGKYRKEILNSSF